jgi:hypothetical protein
LKVVTANLEPSLASAQPDQKFQFERFGYFERQRGQVLPFASHSTPRQKTAAAPFERLGKILAVHTPRM